MTSLKRVSIRTGRVAARADGLHGILLLGEVRLEIDSRSTSRRCWKGASAISSRRPVTATTMLAGGGRKIDEPRGTAQVQLRGALMFANSRLCNVTRSYC